MAVGDAHVFPGFLTPVLTQFSFQGHQLLFSYASAEVRGENMPEKKFRLNQVSNLQPLFTNNFKTGMSEIKIYSTKSTIETKIKELQQESDTLTTEPPGWGGINETLNFENKLC